MFNHFDFTLIHGKFVWYFSGLILNVTWSMQNIALWATLDLCSGSRSWATELRFLNAYSGSWEFSVHALPHNFGKEQAISMTAHNHDYYEELRNKTLQNVQWSSLVMFNGAPAFVFFYQIWT